MLEMQTLIEGEQFGSIEEANRRLAELTKDGRLSQRARAWKQDDPKWRAQQLAYDALEVDNLPDALRLTTEAIRLDPDCTDAQRLQVSVAGGDAASKIRLMREVVARAERNFGEQFFQDTMGRFWGDVKTRPYLRAKLHLAELLAENGEEAEAIEVYQRIMELNAGDNLGARYRLLGLLLANKRSGEALQLLDRKPAEETVMGACAWARVLACWLAGDGENAAAALVRARRVNPYMESYAAGRRPIPRESPDYYTPGQETEAQVFAREQGFAWQRHPEAQRWLREQRP